MSFVSRGARAAARHLRRSVQRQTRRYDSHHAPHGHGEAHQGESAFHVAQGPANESFGPGLYISLASIPFFAAVYAVAANPGDNFISRLVKKYEIGQEAEERKNVIHLRLMEQAAADRQLFASTPIDTNPVLRYPEAFNHGSPWNVSAGQGGADLTALTKHYHEQAQAQEEARLARLKKGKVVSVYE
ncbi:uncharacterized protein A1O9_04854 [Exophiala aquamarina CBS 119918]|uniref:Uncharacterized protein n=1 Tax=Exophiala aquamarina CBS 119918 TaxID=1182545 RepID=A0A072PWN0_9EURO|nr:uncharacterized protein A1O9_04854 [Exophiala aquamarina CBS 119918]KEF60005.1 hypothetical protein A1O9_04854 [Exophiala aquamarina CBS 119918]